MTKGFGCFVFVGAVMLILPSPAKYIEERYYEKATATVRIVERRR